MIERESRRGIEREGWKIETGRRRKVGRRDKEKKKKVKNR